MILDRKQQAWIAAASLAGVLASVSYVVYALLAANGPRGGSAMGLIFGSAGTALIVFECLLSLRKKYPASPLGHVQTWLRGHIWLGLLSFLLILFHAGFHWGRGLAALLMWMFLIITISGMVGVALQHYLPRRMSELVTRETVYDQIPEVVRALALESDERVEFVTADLGIAEALEEVVRAGGKKFYFDLAKRKSAAEKVEAERQKRKAQAQIAVDEPSTTALRSHYLQEVRPFLHQHPSRLSLRLFHNRAAVAAYFNRLRTIMPVAVHDVLADVEQICEERRQLRVQQQLHRWLHGWLLVHVPVSMGLLVLTAVHAVISLRY